MKFALRIASALLMTAALASPALSRGLVVCDYTNSAGTFSADVERRVDLRALRAVCAFLDKYKADYKVLPPSAVLTEFARTGVVYYQRSGTYGYVTTGPSETFSWVIHVGFNGSKTTYWTTYRPESLTVFAKLPTVPQLFITASNNASYTQSTSDSTGVAEYIDAGGGSGNHEGEGTCWAPGRTERFFDTIFGGAFRLNPAIVNGGIRSLLCAGANATMTNLELTGNMPTNPDSLNAAVSDTVKVFEKLNLHKSGAARIVFASVVGNAYQDSVLSIAGTEYNTEYIGVNWPVLGFAFAHLDSLTGGDVLGNKRPLQWSAVVSHVGGTSDRRHAGGMFAADSSIRTASADSVASTGVKLTLAADPESLAVNPSIAVAWKRAGQVRFSPHVRVGLDSTVAGNGSATYARPVDVWGRYRNRAVYGGADSLRTIANADTSIYQQLLRAKANLASVVGSGYLSRALIPPDGDWSPYQLRRGQNFLLADSIAWLAAKWGGPIIQTGYGRDNDPNYVTNPKGFLRKQGKASVQAASLRGERPVFLSFAYQPIRGSRVGSKTDGLSFLGPLADSLPPVCDPGPCGGPNAAVIQENLFWHGFFGPDKDASFFAYDGFSDNDFVYGVPRLYDFGPASVVMLPEQAFGGQCSCGPNRWGFFVIKHLMAATQLMNYAAGRTIMANAWPEDVRP